MNKYLRFIMEVILILILLSLWGFCSAIRPFKINSSLTPANFGVSFQSITFLTKDNVKIHGWFIPNKNTSAKTIILTHGYPADKGNILPATIFLHEKYNLLYFDFRYLGQSEGNYSTIGKNETLDLLGAIQFLKDRKIQKVGVWGFSLGAAVALMTAPSAPEIKAIVSDSSYARLDWMAIDYYRIPILSYPLASLTRLWGRIILNMDINDVSPSQSARTLKIPILLVHSRNDDVVSFRNALLLQDSLKNNKQTEVMFLDYENHGEQSSDFDKIVSQFFYKNLGR